MSAVKYLSPRISYKLTPEFTSIAISAKGERWKETLLMAWVLAWTASGLYFIFQLGADLPRDTKLAIVVLLFFWVYFEFQIGRALFWRLWGVELIRFSEGQLSVKRSIKGYGKRMDYFLDNIAQFEVVERAPRSIVTVMEDSFWVIGGERIAFEHLGRKVGVGLQISTEEAKKLRDLLEKQRKKFV